MDVNRGNRKMRDDDKHEAIFSLVIVVLILITISSCGIFVDKYEVLGAVEKAGYANPEIIATHRFLPALNGCSGSDAAAFVMMATNASGEKVKLVACAGFPFKGVTLRF